MSKYIATTDHHNAVRFDIELEFLFAVAPLVHIASKLIIYVVKYSMHRCVIYNPTDAYDVHSFACFSWANIAPAGLRMQPWNTPALPSLRLLRSYGPGANMIVASYGDILNVCTYAFKD